MAKLFFTSLLLFMLLACSDSKSVVDPDNPRVANITLIASINGIGDNGYNDCILAGFFRFYENRGVPFHLLQPESMEEADSLAKDWLKNNRDTDSSMLVLASSEYKQVAQKLDVRFTGVGNKVLLFEADSSGLPENVYSFWIDRYGASYLAGAIVGTHSGVVLATAPGFSSLETSISGFRAGFNAHKTVKDSLKVLYVSDIEGDEAAFNDVESTYLVLATLLRENYADIGENIAVFPLLGGAIKGARRAFIDFPITTDFMIGMDVDQSGVLPKVPFTMTVEIKDVVIHYLTEWLAGREWPRFSSFGLEDGGTSIVFNEKFGDIKIFEERYNKYRAEAIREEAEHAKK